MPPFFSARTTLSTPTCQESAFIMHIGRAQYKLYRYRTCPVQKVGHVGDDPPDAPLDALLLSPRD